MTAKLPIGVEIGNSRRHIFQMDRAELQKLHQLLWTRQKNSSGELSARSLRIRATEWLLLNGLSTLHRFGRELTEIGEEAADKVPEIATAEWEIPASSEECNTCRQYRVGKGKNEGKSLKLVKIHSNSNLWRIGHNAERLWPNWGKWPIAKQKCIQLR